MLFAIVRETTVPTYEWPYEWPTLWLRTRRGRSRASRWDLMRGFGEPPYVDGLLPSTLRGLQLFRTYDAAAREAERLERRPTGDIFDMFGADVRVIGWVEYCGDATGEAHEDCAACPALSRACAAQRRMAIQGGSFSPSIRQAAWAGAREEQRRAAIFAAYQAGRIGSWDEALEGGVGWR